MILDYIKTLLIICILTISFIYALDFEYGFIGKQTQKSKRFFEINNNDSLLYDYAKLNLKLKDSNFYLILRTNDDDFLMLFNKQSNLGSLTKDDIYVEIPNNTTIVIKGINKQNVGDVAAKIRQIRKPEPYKGKGIKYSDEIIRRKAGKTVGAGAA